MIIVFKRAIFITALFFFLFSFAIDQKQTALVSPKIETYKDLILKAQVLLMQKDRAQAINILIMGLQKEENKGVAHQELLNKLNKVTQIFLEESTQSIYELAITLDKNNKKMAIDKLNEVFVIEPQNLQIIKALLNRYLSENNCSKSLKLMDSFKQVNPYDLELLAYEVHLAVCQKNQARYLELKKSSDSSNQITPEFWTLSDLRMKLITGFESLIIETNIQSHYPEIMYLKWKLGLFNSQEQSSRAEEYLQVCKSWRNFYSGPNFPDPWVCSNIKEVEESREKK